jgi:hypothetical protein
MKDLTLDSRSSGHDLKIRSLSATHSTAMFGINLYNPCRIRNELISYSELRKTCQKKLHR